MKLWLIERIKDPFSEWDIYTGFVVRAEDEQAARQLALEERSESWIGNKGEWLSAEFATCTEIALAGDAEVILYNFKRG